MERMQEATMLDLVHLPQAPGEEQHYCELRGRGIHERQWTQNTPDRLT
jgi:hypothetical protein